MDEPKPSGHQDEPKTENKTSDETGPRMKAKWTDGATVILTFLIAVAALWSAWIFQGQLSEARRATDVQARPWISVEDVSISGGEDLIVGEKVIMTTVAVAIKNIGHSPATHVAVRVQLSAFGSGSFEDVVRGVCQNAVGDTNTAFGQTIFQDKTGTPINYPIVLPPSETARYWKQGGGVFSVVGCAAYRSPLSREVYYTGFIYTILVLNRSYPTASARIPSKDILLQNALAGFITK